MSARPGGWVQTSEGPKWVALVRDLDDADLIVWPDAGAPLYTAEVRHLDDPHRMVVVERWGDGSMPGPTQPTTYQQHQTFLAEIMGAGGPVCDGPSILRGLADTDRDVVLVGTPTLRRLAAWADTCPPSPSPVESGGGGPLSVHWNRRPDTTDGRPHALMVGSTPMFRIDDEEAAAFAAQLGTPARSRPVAHSNEVTMTAELICPGCGSPVPNEHLLGMEVPGVYDGVLIWTDQRCGHAWPRFAPDAGSGYSRLYVKAVEIIAGWDDK